MINVNLNQEVLGHDADGTLILGKEKKPPLLCEILLYALRTSVDADRSTGFKDKNARFLLIKKLEGAPSAEISEGEISLLRERVGAVFLQPEIVGRVAELLNG